MDFTTLLGIISGLVMLFYAISSTAGYHIFINIPGLLITLGGTFAATLINFPINDVLRSFSIVRKVFLAKNKNDLKSTISLITSLAKTYREQGGVALEDRLHQISDPFIKTGINMVIDNEDPERIDYHFETELLFLQERHKRGQRMFLAMGKYAPAFGMIGTLIGLINMLNTLNSPSQIGKPMAIALTTTFYGVLLAHLLFLPIAGKLKERSAEEINQKMLIAEGITRIALGKSERLVREELLSYLPSSGRRANLEILE